MTIIADSGSTKTTWMDVESGNKIVTEGLNPHFTSDDAFLAACTAVRDKVALHSPLSTSTVPAAATPHSANAWSCCSLKPLE